MMIHKIVFANIFVLGAVCTTYAKGAIGLKEKEIEQAYKNYWSTPVENWSDVIRKQTMSSYTVSTGDTLSELSAVFFGNENYWTKMWATNDYIKNPHLIYLGDTIYFIPGSGKKGAAPVLGFQKADDEGRRQEVVSFAVDEEEVKMPDPVAYIPVLEQLPGSFPSWVPKAPPTDAGVMAIERDRTALLDAKMIFGLESFIGNHRTETLGVVKGFRNVFANTASTFTRLYIKERGEGLQEEEVYSVVERKGGVQTRFGMKYPGVYIYEYLGEVKILRNIKGSLYEAETTTANNLIPKGAFLIRGRVPAYDLSFNIHNVKDVAAKLLRGNQTFGHVLYGIGQVVFLSKGHNEGVEAGDVVRVNEERASRRDSELPDVDVKNPVGIVKIVSSTPSFSTGIVVSLADYMLPGDTTNQ